MSNVPKGFIEVKEINISSLEIKEAEYEVTPVQISQICYIHENLIQFNNYNIVVKESRDEITAKIKAS